MKKLLLFICSALFIVSCGESKKQETTQPEIDYSTVSDNEVPATDNHIILKAYDNMRFDKTDFTVKAGEEVTLKLINEGTMPKESMGHNFVLLKPDTDSSEFASAAVTSSETEFIPTDYKDKIVAHTKLLGGKESDEIKFTLEPGTYEFLCSFPGHYGSMRGKITAIQ